MIRLTRLRAAARRSGDAGQFALELVILAPAVFLLLFGVIQGGLYFHARQVAHRAAQQGVDAGRVLDAQPGDGVAAARDFLDRMGRSLDSPQVSSAGSTTQKVQIEVRGGVVSLVPGLHLPVVARAQAPIEQVTP